MSIENDFFVANAPGSTEKYLIPNHFREDYLSWCLCEFFNEAWQWHYDNFKQYEINLPEADA